MVGLGVGLLLLSIALSWVGWQMGQHRDLLLRTRLTHDLHAVGHLVQQAITQAGHQPDSSPPTGDSPPSLWPASAAHGSLGGAEAPVLPFENGLRFRQTMGPDHASWTERALRVQSGTLHWRLQADGPWQALTDPRSLTVNRWAWQARQQTWPVPYDCHPACHLLAPAAGSDEGSPNAPPGGYPHPPAATDTATGAASQPGQPSGAHTDTADAGSCSWGVARWHYRIQLAGQATRRPALSHEVQRTQRVMNDQMVMLCP